MKRKSDNQEGKPAVPPAVRVRRCLRPNRKLWPHNADQVSFYVTEKALQTPAQSLERWKLCTMVFYIPLKAKEDRAWFEVKNAGYNCPPKHTYELPLRNLLDHATMGTRCKDYIQKRLGILIPDATTDNIIQVLKNEGINHFSPLLEFFTAPMVVFRNYVGLPSPYVLPSRDLPYHTYMGPRIEELAAFIATTPVAGFIPQLWQLVKEYVWLENIYLYSDSDFYPGLEKELQLQLQLYALEN